MIDSDQFTATQDASCDASAKKKALKKCRKAAKKKAKKAFCGRIGAELGKKDCKRQPECRVSKGKCKAR